MASFTEKTRAPLIESVSRRLHDALAAPVVKDKIEQLISVEHDSQSSITRIINGEHAKPLLGLAGGLFTGLAAFILAPAYGVLLGVAGAALAIGGTAYSERATNNLGKALRERDALNAAVGRGIYELATTYPQETAQSPRFMRILRERFNVASSPEDASSPSPELSRSAGPTQSMSNDR